MLVDYEKITCDIALRYFEIYAWLLYEILSAVCQSDVYLQNKKLNIKYVLLKNELNRILLRDDFEKFANLIPVVPESILDDEFEFELYRENELKLFLSFLGKFEKEFLLNGCKEATPGEKEYIYQTSLLIKKHRKICGKVFKEIEDKSNDELRMKNKVFLHQKEIIFNDNLAQIIIGGEFYSMPPFKNNYYVCRIMFSRPVHEPVCWDEVYDVMQKDNSMDKSNWRKVYDAVNSVNNKIKELFNTDDNLFSWNNKCVIRNF